MPNPNIEVAGIVYAGNRSENASNAAVLSAAQRIAIAEKVSAMARYSGRNSVRVVAYEGPTKIERFKTPGMLSETTEILWLNRAEAGV